MPGKTQVAFGSIFPGVFLVIQVIGHRRQIRIQDDLAIQLDPDR
jgi:hypothetical protein